MYFISVKPSYSQLLYSIPVLIPDFDSPFPVTGTGTVSYTHLTLPTTPYV